jgi:hypothetical protein
MNGSISNPTSTAPMIFQNANQVRYASLKEVIVVRKRMGSRREESNTPSTDYDSVALTLSYTGVFVVL